MSSTEPFVRTKTRASGGITPEEREQMGELVKEWTAIAFRSEPINPAIITPAIKDLYRAAGLNEPKVVIVSSPVVMVVASVVAACAIEFHRRGLLPSTIPVEDIPWAVARLAQQKQDNSRRGKEWGREVAEEFLGGNAKAVDATVEAMKSWWNMHHGGNMWASWCCYICASRDVLGLDLPEFVKFKPYEASAREGGMRMMHSDFCVVSDFPEYIKIDEQNRAHCEDGPSHRWRDGWCFYNIHGVAVDARVVEHPETITVQDVQNEENAEVRRVLLDRFGKARYIQESGAIPVHADEYGTLYHVDRGDDEPLRMVHLINSTAEPDGTFKEYWTQVPLRGGAKWSFEVLGEEPGNEKDRLPLIDTAHRAVAWTYGRLPEHYCPVLET